MKLSDNYFWRHVSAVNSHRQANVKHILGTMKVCTLWDPTLFTKYVKMYVS